MRRLSRWATSWVSTTREFCPMRESMVSSTLRSSDCASSTITKASWRERPRMCVSGSTSSMPRERSEEHTSELQSRFDLVCRLLLEKKKKYTHPDTHASDDSD